MYSIEICGRSSFNVIRKWRVSRSAVGRKVSLPARHKYGPMHRRTPVWDRILEVQALSYTPYIQTSNDKYIQQVKTCSVLQKKKKNPAQIESSSTKNRIEPITAKSIVAKSTPTDDVCNLKKKWFSPKHTISHETLGQIFQMCGQNYGNHAPDSRGNRITSPY